MSQTVFNTLKIEKKTESVLLVTLNRPSFRNAINSEMMHELLTLWRDFIPQQTELRCVILTGSEKAFCAGADLKERNSMELEEWRKQRTTLEKAMLHMLDCPLPILAAVNGFAFGGGLELVLASDFAYAANTATFSQSEVKVGLIPGALGTQHLPRACGINRAKELAFTGTVFSAEQAFQWGMINKICDDETLIEEIEQTANVIANNAPLAIKQVKQALNKSQEVGIKAGFAFEIEAYNYLLPTKDRIEGIRAFNEKRKPQFTGE